MPEVFEQIMKADFDFPSPYWDEISADAKDFISKLLVVDSKKRATCKQSLEHKWITGATGTKTLNIKSDLEKFNSQRKLAIEKKP